MSNMVNDNSQNGNSVNQNRTGPVLMVAEKPRVARVIANNYPYRTGAVRERRVEPPHHSGLFPERIDRMPYFVYEFDGRLPGDSTSRKFKVISTLGHVAEYTFGEEIDRLHTGGHGELLRMTNFIKDEAEGCDDLILWLDWDNHGEAICFEVIDIIGWRPDDCRVRRA